MPRQPVREWNGHAIHRCRWCDYESFLARVETHEAVSHGAQLKVERAIERIAAATGAAADEGAHT